MRLYVLTLMAAGSLLIGCQQEKVTSSQPATAPQRSVTPPTTTITGGTPPPAPRVPPPGIGMGAGPGPGVIPPPPPGAGGRPIPPPPPMGVGVGPGVVPPPPPGPGGAIPVPPPPPGMGMGPGPGPGVVPPPTIPPPGIGSNPPPAPPPGIGMGPGPGTSTPPGVTPSQPNQPLPPPGNPTQPPTTFVPPPGSNPPQDGAPIGGTPIGPQQPGQPAQPSVPPNFQTPPPGTPATQTLPVSELPPAPPPVPVPVQPAAPPPVPVQWANIPQPLPQTAQCPPGMTSCVGQRIAATTPPPQQDCRLNPGAPGCTSQPTPVPVQPAQPSIPMPRPRPSTAPQPVVQTPPQPVCTPVAINPKKVASKLDVLLVMDTSASMRGGRESGTGGELGMIIPEMGSFVKQLDPNTDVRIGMLLGHARANSRSPHNVHGRLFRVDSRDPGVIDYVKLRRECPQNNEIDKCVNKKVSSILQHKLRNMPNDHTEAEGEALFSSLYDALSEKSLRGEIEREGLLRSDATLAVIFMSDENEVCYDYTGTGYQPARVLMRDPSTGKMMKKPAQDPHEKIFLEHDCKTLANGGPLNYTSMWEALKSVKNGDESKLVVTGVVYKDNNIPTDLQDQWREMEMGHGYVDLFEMSHNPFADLASVDRHKKVITFGPQLAFLGKHTNFKMRYKGSFTCNTKFDARQINTSTVQLHIYDSSQNKDVAVYSGQCVNDNQCGSFTGAAVSNLITGRRTKLEVSVKDEQKFEKLLESNGFQSGEARITFEPLQPTASQR